MRTTKFYWLLVLALSTAIACGDDDGGGGNFDAGQTGDGDGGQTTLDAGPSSDARQAACVPVNGTNLALEEIATGLEWPVLVTHAPDDPRLFVLERSGRIRIIENGQLLATPFLDVTALVRTNDVAPGSEQGLLGLAFHPNYAVNGRFFVNYTAETPGGDTVVAEYSVSANANVANTTETRVIVIGQDSSNHNGGMIEFGPDGFLYIGMGDGGGSDDPNGRGQDTDSMLGSMLRIDVNGATPYEVPSTNPFFNSMGTEAKEIWSYGLRNPWRFSFDKQTGDLYIADVGQSGGEAREEVNVQPASSAGGENYGWDDMQGTTCYNNPACIIGDYDLPLDVYDHSAEGRCSISGGYVYRGTCFPDLDGWYFYGDYCASTVYKFEYSGGMAMNQMDLTSDIDPGGLLQGISAFGQDTFGEVYVVSFGSGDNGRIYRITAGP